VLTTFVPARFKRHGVKKVVVHAEPTAPQADPPTMEGARADPHVVKTLAQGFYWQRLLSEHRVRGAAEIAAVEGVDRARVTKVTRLALLAPELVQAIVEGRLPVTLQQLMRQELPDDWSEQRKMLAR